jgi:hypothetical protein
LSIESNEGGTAAAAGIKEDCWSDTVHLAEKLDVSPSLLATKELIAKLLCGEVCGEKAVSIADHLQSSALLDHRLFTSSLVKVAAL